MFVIYLARNTNHFYKFFSRVLSIRPALTFQCHDSFIQFSINTFSNREFWLKLRKFSLNLRISSTTSLFTSDILLCNDLFCSSSDKTIGINSLFNSLSSNSSVYRGMVMIAARQKSGCYVSKTKYYNSTLNYTRPLATARYCNT